MTPFSKWSLVSLGKVSYLDIKAKDRRDRHYNVEIQVKVPENWPRRALYYASRLYTSQLKKGHDYEELRRTMSISILDSNLFGQEKGLHNVYKFRNNEDFTVLDDELIEMHFIELEKFDKTKPRQLLTRFEKWLHVLRFGERYGNGDIILDEALGSEEEIKRAIEEMCNVNEDEQARQLIEAREKWRLDYNSEISAAKRAVRLDVARKLLPILDDSRIAESTGLSLEQVKELRREAFDPEELG